MNHLAKSMLRCLQLGALCIAATVTLLSQTGGVPAGFRPIFDGRNLKGWHVSRSNHHGHEPDFHVQNGVLIAAEHPYGQGGILLTDKKYHNFELYLEVNPDSERSEERRVGKE